MSITYWNRLESRPRGRSIRRALAAEIRDPLWLLARQWQLGELSGEDAGSPQGIVVETETIAVDRWEVRGGQGTLDPTVPVESQVLAEAYVPDLAMCVEMAQAFLRLLGDETRAQRFLDEPSYRLQVPVSAPLDPAEPAAERFARFMASRLFDGFKLYWAIAHGEPYPGRDDDQNIRDVAAVFRDWVEATYRGLRLAVLEKDPDSWHRERLEHRATLATASGAARSIRLAARPGGDGALDWDSFELAAHDPTVAGVIETFALQPTHVRFPGMPNARFWDFEEGTMSFADVEPDTRDLAKMMLVEFALVQGADWFYFDLPQPVGTLRRIRSLVVKDVFGRETAVTPAPDNAVPRWAMYRVSRAADAAPDTPSLADFLLVPPTTAAVQQSARPLEEVLFARDEMANMAWAIERATPSPLGEPWPGHERDAALPAPPPAPAVALPLAYRIMTRVPVHWTPLLPARRRVGGSLPRPQVVLLTGNVTRDPPIEKPIKGKILQPDTLDGRAYVLNEEEVPRAGVQVRRLMVRSRWTDGTSHLWFARIRVAGRGETGSGLRFDSALDTRR